MIYTSRFRIGDRVHVVGYPGLATVTGIRFTKDRILYDVERDLNGVAIRDVSSAIVTEA